MRFMMVVIGGWLAACGASGPAAPGPLKYMLDDAHIARVPSESQPKVYDAQKEYAIAKADRMNAESALNEVATELDVAKNEADSARLEENSALSKQKAAAASGDMTRKNTADRELRTAQLGRETADLKLTYLKEKREYLKVHVRWAQHNAYAKESKLELEKAKVAKANNIQPPGFVYDLFESQYKERSEAAQRAKVDADDRKKRADDKRNQWKAKEKDWYKEKGGTPPEDIKPPPADKPAPDVIR